MKSGDWVRTKSNGDGFFDGIDQDGKYKVTLCDHKFPDSIGKTITVKRRELTVIKEKEIIKARKVVAYIVVTFLYVALQALRGFLSLPGIWDVVAFLVLVVLYCLYWGFVVDRILKKKK